MMWRLMAGFAATLLGGAIIASCAAHPSADSPGRCALSCGNAAIGASYLQLKAKASAISIACGKVSSAHATSPVRIDFVVWDPTSTTSTSSSTATGDTGTNGSSTTTASGFTDGRPVGSVSFEPIVNGALDTSSNGTHADNADVSSLAGVSTSSADFCSDSCGVASIEVTPMCIPGVTNDVSVQIHSGASYSEVVQISVVAESEDTSLTTNDAPPPNDPASTAVENTSSSNP